MDRSIFQGQDGEGVSVFNKQLANNSDIYASQALDKLRELPVDQLEEDTIAVEINGNISFIKINPKLLASRTAYVIENLIKPDPKYSFIKYFLTKPVIWTYDVNTAATDGIRIFMSPIFARNLFSIAKQEQKQRAAQEPASAKDKKALNIQEDINSAKYIIFVIVHECYHVLYQHIKRERLLLGMLTDFEHNLANCAQDLEINRDIESCFPELRGSTSTIGGIWWENPDFFNINNEPFKKNVFEEIYEDFEKNQKVKSEVKKNMNKNGDNQDFEDEEDLSKKIFGKGWEKAIEDILNHRIDPEKFF